jgi:hypothetical protein
MLDDRLFLPRTLSSFFMAFCSVAVLADGQGSAYGSQNTAVGENHGSITVHNYEQGGQSAPDRSLELIDIRGIETPIPEWNMTQLSVDVVSPDEQHHQCGPDWTGKQYVDHSLCNAAQFLIFPNFMFGDQFLDITVQNTGNIPVILSQVAFKATTSYQVYVPPAGDFADPVDISTEVTIRPVDDGLLPIRVEVECLNKKDIAFYSSFQFDGFQVDRGRCFFDASLDRGQGNVVVGSEHLNNCRVNGLRTSMNDGCDDVYFHNFTVKEPILLVGRFDTPMRIPAGEPMRFKLTIKELGVFPNNMAGELSFNYGKYSIGSLYFFTYDSGSFYALTSSDSQ